MTSAARSRDCRIWIWFWIEAGSVGSADSTALRSAIVFLRGSSITTDEEV